MEFRSEGGRLMNQFGEQFHRGNIFTALAALLLGAGMIAGCSETGEKADIAPAETAVADTECTKNEFTKEELLADYDALWEMLEEDYLYFPILERQGVNTESLKTSSRLQLESRIDDLNGFYYLLNNMFEKMNFFAHLSVVNPEIYDVYLKYLDTEDSLGSGWQKILQNPQTQTVYAYLKDASEEELATSADMTDDYCEVDTSYDVQRKAVTFIVKSFSDAVLERDRYFISDYLTSLGDVEIEHIIFDISGNVGGNDLYWQNNIVAPFGGTYEWSNYLYLRETELTRSYYFDDFNPQPVSEITDHALPSFVQELDLTHVIQDRPTLANDAALGENISAAKRWVIIDNRVYSSADSFSAFCKATGWATLVGQATLGDGQGVSPVLIALPNTGLLVRFSALAAETPDGTLNAIAGTEPDIAINPRLTTSRDEINRLIDEKLP